MNQPVLSVGILCRNEEASIERMLASVLRQSLWNATSVDRRQIVVCANGCSDGTVDVVRRLSSGIPELELVELADAGKSQSWNVLRRHLRRDADWWFFADADVVLHWQALERMLATADDQPEAAVIASVTVSSARFYPSRHRGPLIAARVESERVKPQRREVSARLYAIRREAGSMLTLPPGLLNEDQYLTRLLGADRIYRCREARVFFREPRTIADLVRYQLRTRIGSFQARRVDGRPIDTNRGLSSATRRAVRYRGLSWRAWTGKVAWLPLRLYVEWRARRFDVTRLQASDWIDITSSKLPPSRAIQTWRTEPDLPRAANAGGSGVAGR